MTLHRWLSLGAAIFWLLQAITGILIAAFGGAIGFGLAAAASYIALGLYSRLQLTREAPAHDGRREEARDAEGRSRHTPGEPGQIVFPPVSFLSLGLRLSPRRLAHRHVAVVPAADRSDTLRSL